MPPVRLLPLLGLAAFLLGGCDPLSSPDPTKMYVGFLKALERGDTKVAFEALSKRAQERLTAQAEAASKASGGVLKNDPALLAFPMAGRPGNVREIKVLDRKDDRAVLQVTAATGRPEEVTVIFENGAWRIDP